MIIQNLILANIFDAFFIVWRITLVKN